MLRVDFDLAGITTQVDKLAEVIEGAIRPAAQAAAQVFYNEVKLRAARASEKGWGTGNLSKAIYQAYAKKYATPDRAIYHVSWRRSLTVFDQGAPTARSYGHLLEYGWLQRYATYLDKKGNWVTAVRPEMLGKPKPKRRASQAMKDAYYVLRKGGPIQHPPRAFLRSSYEAKKQEALAAADKEMQERILKAFI